MSDPLPVPVLHGELVTLRQHRESDLEPVFERCLDDDTRRYTTIPLEYTREMAQEYLTGLLEPSPALISWAIEVDGSYAGTIDLRALAVADGAGDLGFVTHPAFRGRGVMSEAVRLVVTHAVDGLGWHEGALGGPRGQLGQRQDGLAGGVPGADVRARPARRTRAARRRVDQHPARPGADRARGVVGPRTGRVGRHGPSPV